VPGILGKEEVMLHLSPQLTQAAHYLFLLGVFYMFVLALSNIIWLRLSSRKPRRRRGGRVSVLIPARNEQDNIGRCLESLLQQTYENYEIIVLDDQSSDRTWEIISQYQQRHPGRVRALKGEPLPPAGWHGKPHAMQQLAAHATGEYFLFTDADTVHTPESISWAVTNLEWHRVDFVSGYVYQELQSLGEALIVPATYIMSTIVMPLWLIAATRLPFFSFAIGQLVMFRRKAFEAIGGYSCVAQDVTEDIFVARQLKRAGFRTIFLDIRKHVSCRMYESYRPAFNGLAKNVSDVLGNSLLTTTLASLLVLFFLILPYTLLPLYLLADDPGARLTAVNVLLFQLTWCLVLYDRGLKWYVPFLYPILFLHLLAILWKGYGQFTWGAGILWKDRLVKRAPRVRGAYHPPR
jgi:chlorobactene glucosyltransferase